jgi:hypothetical protein
VQFYVLHLLGLDMRHEKILKRGDGSRVCIRVEFHADWNASKPVWDFVVHACEKGKRTWTAPYNSNEYSFRQLSMEDRAKFIREKCLLLASAEEVESTMLELWETLRPSM